jgi:tetratricopeptide (TPR) repeat protein
MMQRAAIKLVKGDFDGVIAELKTVEALFARSPQVKYQLALAYLKIAQPFRAEGYLQQALRFSPNYPEAILQMAELNLQKGNPADTIAALTRLIEQHPQVTPAYVLLAKAYRAQGNQPKALALLKLLSTSSPHSPEGPYLVGAILAELQQKPEAREALAQSIRIQENYWPALELLVDLDLADQQAAAGDRVEGLVKKYPAAVQPWLLRAKVRLVGGDTDGAEADLLKAIELEPKMQYPYLLLARIYYQSNRVTAARDKLAALTAQRPSLNALMMLGMLHTALKDHEAARANYEQAIALDATFSPALNNLAVLYSEQPGQLEKAHDIAKRARDLAPNDPVVADTFGWILFRRGQYEGAQRPLQMAAEKIPGDPEIQYHLGMAQYYLGQAEPARQSFRTALAAPAGSPVHEDAVRRLAILALDPANPDPASRTRLEGMAREMPDDPVVLTRLAELEAHDGAAKPAAEHYEAVLKINPGAVPAMMSLLELYAGPLPKPDRVHDLAKLVRAAAPNDGQITWRLGRLLYQAGDFAWAATLLAEAVRTLPGQPELLFDLARTQYGVGRVTEAQAALEKVLGADAPPALRGPAAQMASLIAAAKQAASTETALTDARQVLGSDPDNIPALVVTALAREHQADYKGAAGVYHRILELDPLFVPAMRQLAILYGEQLGDDPQAEALATKALQTFPDDPELNYECGVVNYRRGDYAKAVRFLQQSLRVRDHHAETLLFLGLSHFQLKNFSESKAELQQALALKLPPQEETEARRVLDLADHGGGAPNGGL